MNITLKLAAASCALVLYACKDNSSNSQQELENLERQTKSTNSFEQAYQQFDEAEYKQHILTLSSDEFGGRAPATPGGQKTVDYLVTQFQTIGLKPGNGDSYTQEVPLVSVTTQPTTPLQLGEMPLSFGKDFVATSSTLAKQVDLNNSELVFVGYGIVAPEYDWNDYEGVDMTGKTAVILVNDPGFATQDAALFSGNTMTYYGRWTYKYEEAARQGAAGAIIIHETAPASYGWNVVESSWTGPQFQLPASGTSQPLVDVEMWITSEVAGKAFEQAKLDFLKLKKSAETASFKPIKMGISASVSITNTVERSVSNNVMATLPGSETADEHILYMAHWDHLGTASGKDGDNIYNGALDNATGTAGLLMIAKAYQSLAVTPKRSITFIAVTAEEQGLLGSKYYASNPSQPLANTVGVINMDSVNIKGRKKDFTVVGFNKSELQNYLAIAAQRQNRGLREEASPERGGFYRSDHFSLAKFGVPAIYAGGGVAALNEIEQQRAEAINDQIASCYHQVCDEYDEKWSLKSAIDDLQVFFETGYQVGNTNDWPNWNKGTEFKAIRDQTMMNKSSK